MARTIKYLLLGVTYALSGALLISYMSVWIPPDKLWIPAFFGLAFPYLFMVNLILFVYWLLRLKKISVVILLVMLLGWNNVRHYYRLPVKNKRDREKISQDTGFTLTTFNVRSFNVNAWSANVGKDEQIIRFLKKIKPDILCLQEFYTDEKRFPEQKIVNELNYPYHYISYIQQYHSRSHYGLAVFSRFPLKHKKNIRFDESSNQSQQCDVIMGNDTLRLFNNHLQSTNLNKQKTPLNNLNEEGEALREVKDISLHLRGAFMKRARQAKMLKQHIEKSPYPLVICGDFNDTPVSYTYHVLSAGLKDAFVESGKGLGKTYHGIFPSYRIDYILHDPRWKAVQYKTYHNRLSDHYPVSCLMMKKRMADQNGR
ncbi:MAG: endonuclease/exonuclease/phosphatase family protein [Bacteroidales bacterium]|nr:endonuclease/exonuclease/phosphatase family protein [Bacteroidales bacterium]